MEHLTGQLPMAAALLLVTCFCLVHVADELVLAVSSC